LPHYLAWIDIFPTCPEKDTGAAPGGSQAAGAPAHLICKKIFEIDREIKNNYNVF
jgi:hypothetical protein